MTALAPSLATEARWWASVAGLAVACAPSGAPQATDADTEVLDPGLAAVDATEVIEADADTDVAPVATDATLAAKDAMAAKIDVADAATAVSDASPDAKTGGTCWPCTSNAECKLGRTCSAWNGPIATYTNVCKAPEEHASPAPECDVDCKQDPYYAPSCKSSGRCKAWGGFCAPGSNADCASSDLCKQQGLCSFQPTACVALTDADCAGSNACKLEKKCSAVNGVCKWKSACGISNPQYDLKLDPACKAGGGCQYLPIQYCTCACVQCDNEWCVAAVCDDSFDKCTDAGSKQAD